MPPALLVKCRTHNVRRVDGPRNRGQKHCVVALAEKAATRYPPYDTGERYYIMPRLSVSRGGKQGAEVRGAHKQRKLSVHTSLTVSPKERHLDLAALLLYYPQYLQVETGTETTGQSG